LKITDIRTYKLFHKYPKPKEGPYHPTQFFTYGLLIKVLTDKGITGIGAAPDTYWSIPPIYENFIQKIVKPQLIGKTIEINNLQRLLNSIKCKGQHVEAMNGVETALWDILGKIKNVPIHSLIGGARKKKLKIYGSKIIAKEPENAAREIKDLARKGYAAVKVQMGGYSPAKDLERIKAIHEQEDDVSIVVDVNGRYTNSVTKKIAKELDNLDVVWLEEPIMGNLNPSTVSEYSQLTHSTQIPIAGGERLIARAQLKKILERSAIDILQFRVPPSGISETVKMCNMIKPFEIPWAPGCTRLGINVIASAHVCATVSNFIMLEHWKHPGTEELRNNIFKQDIKIENGYLHVPQKPGLGLELNEDAVKKYTINNWDISYEELREETGLVTTGRWFSNHDHY